MFSIPNISKKLLERLRRKSYRQAYLAEHVRRGIVYQIRALRDQREWKQGRFAKLLGKPQSVVSRLEDPSYGKMTVQTLLEVANVFDVALQIRFVSYSSFLRNTRDVSTASMEVPSFDDDTAASAPALGQIIAPGARMALTNAWSRPLRAFSSQFTDRYYIDPLGLGIDLRQGDDESSLADRDEKYENWFSVISAPSTTEYRNWLSVAESAPPPVLTNRNLSIRAARLHG